jgi:hypothetical protein
MSGEAAVYARAVYRPQGTCPRPWIAQAHGQTLFDGRGGQRRFGNERAALKAAVAAAEALAFGRDAQQKDA